jgi:hypothetical protein
LDVSGRDIAETFGAVLVLVFMGFVESVSVAKKFAGIPSILSLLLTLFF